MLIGCYVNAIILSTPSGLYDWVVISIIYDYSRKWCSYNYLTTEKKYTLKNIWIKSFIIDDRLTIVHHLMNFFIICEIFCFDFVKYFGNKLKLFHSLRG